MCCRHSVHSRLEVGSIINPSFPYIHTCWQNKESLESDTISDSSSLALINEIYLKSLKIISHLKLDLN